MSAVLLRRRLEVHLLPDLARPEEFAGGGVVVIDVLRASTTIAAALAAGARCVRPCLEVDEARTLAAGQNPPAVLGGERGGVRIAGFHFGNSPQEYTPQSVGGRELVFTTTNGTRAMLHARQADRMWVGAFVTLGALVRRLQSTTHERLHFVCAGTEGQVTVEDVLLAGAAIDKLAAGQVLVAPAVRAASEANAAGWELNDQARLAVALWRQFQASQRDLAEFLLCESQGGRNLQQLGLAVDVEHVSRIDACDFVPELNLQSWRITRGDDG